MRPVVITLAIAVLFLGSGCSLMFINGPEDQGMACSTDRLAPGIDVMWAAQAGTTSAAMIWSAKDAPEGQVGVPLTIAALELATGLVFAYSAYQGYEKTGRCRTYIQSEFRRVDRRASSASAPSPAGDIARAAAEEASPTDEAAPTDEDGPMEGESADEESAGEESAGEESEAEAPVSESFQDVLARCGAGHRCRDDSGCLSGQFCNTDAYQCVETSCAAHYYEELARNTQQVAEQLVIELEASEIKTE